MAAGSSPPALASCGGASNTGSYGLALPPGRLVLAYLLPPPTFRACPYRTVCWIHAKSLLTSPQLFWQYLPSSLLRSLQLYRTGVRYGEGHGPSLLQQAILYAHLFFGLLYLGVVGDDGRRKFNLCMVIFHRCSTLSDFTSLDEILRSAGYRPNSPDRRCSWLDKNKPEDHSTGRTHRAVYPVCASDHCGDKFSIGKDARPQIVSYFGYMNSMKYFQDNLHLNYVCPPQVSFVDSKTYSISHFRNMYS